jgi:hypothetical protein
LQAGALLVSRDQSNSPIVEPDFDGVTVNVLARFDQSRIVIFASNDLWRAEHAAILVELVEAIGEHGRNQGELMPDIAMNADRCSYHLICSGRFLHGRGFHVTVRQAVGLPDDQQLEMSNESAQADRHGHTRLRFLLIEFAFHRCQPASLRVMA